MQRLQPGSTCSGYTVVSFLGAGGCSQVYEVADAKGARHALKIFDGDAPTASALQQRLAQEGEALAMIEHVNVLGWRETGIHQGSRVFLVLDLVDGGDLGRLIREAGGALPIERAVRLIRQAADGVAAAHRRGIIHRDIKPSNLLVTRDGTVKVADFGVAKLPGWGVKTTAEHQLGTALYLAPEYMLRDEPSALVDVYALGIVLHEAIAGVHPIMPGPATVMRIYQAHLLEEPVPLASVVPEVSADLSNLVGRCLQKDPARRCSLEELREGLEREQDRLLVWRRSAARNVDLPDRDIGLLRTQPISWADGAGTTGDHPDRHAYLPAAAGSATTLRCQEIATPAVEERRSTAAPVESVAPRASSVPYRSRASRAVVFAGGGLGVAALVAAAGWTVLGRTPVPAIPAPAAPPQPAVTVSAIAPAPASAAPPPSMASSTLPSRLAPRRAPALPTRPARRP